MGAADLRLFDRPCAPFYSALQTRSLRDRQRPPSAAQLAGFRVVGDLPDVSHPQWHLTCQAIYGLCFMAKGSFGEILKREREMREVTLNEVTVATRIAPRFLEAFEREEWEKLPGGVFNRGFVRAIARYLGLNEETLLSEYDLAYGEQKTVAPSLVENPIPSPPKWAIAAAALGVLLVAAGLIAGGRYGWRRYAAHRAAKRAAISAAPSPIQPAPALPSLNGDGSSTPSSSAASSTPVTPSSGEPTAAVATPAAPTRLGVVADGRIVLDARLPAGETRHLSARKQFLVSAAHPSAVLLELNGQAMPQLGSRDGSGTMVLSQKDLRQAPRGNSQP
jgi:cytoskeleton protein RodZ